MKIRNKKQLFSRTFTLVFEICTAGYKYDKEDFNKYTQDYKKCT